MFGRHTFGASLLPLAMLALVLRSGLAAAEPVKASFDCAKAATRIEKAICADAALAESDFLLGAQYKGMLDILPDSGKAKLRQNQRNWLKEEVQPCSQQPDSAKLVYCLSRAYLMRTARLPLVVTQDEGNPLTVIVPQFDPNTLSKRVTSGNFEVRWGDGVAVAVNRATGLIRPVYMDWTEVSQAPTGATDESRDTYTLASIVGTLVSFSYTSHSGRGAIVNGNSEGIRVQDVAHPQAPTLTELFGEDALLRALLDSCAEGRCKLAKPPRSLKEALSTPKGEEGKACDVWGEVFPASPYTFDDVEGNSVSITVSYGLGCPEDLEESASGNAYLKLPIPARLKEDLRKAVAEKTLGVHFAPPPPKK